MAREVPLDDFIDRYTPEIARRARAVLKKMRRRLPGSVELVYDNYGALAIGFSPSERPSGALFSIALYPRWINLFFLHGATLPDPKGLLQGDGTRVRHVRIDDAATLDDPAIVALMKAALARWEPFDPSAPRRTIVKAVCPNPRPRRPRTKE
jgi:hypothetical protein